MHINIAVNVQILKKYTKTKIISKYMRCSYSIKDVLQQPYILNITKNSPFYQKKIKLFFIIFFLIYGCFIQQFKNTI